MTILSRLGIYVLALALAFGGGWMMATGYSGSVAEIAALVAQTNKLSADLAIARAAEADAEQRATLLQAAMLDNQETIGDLIDSIDPGPTRDACRLSDDDARRLRAIRYPGRHVAPATARSGLGDAGQRTRP